MSPPISSPLGIVLKEGSDHRKIGRQARERFLGESTPNEGSFSSLTPLVFNPGTQDLVVSYLGLIISSEG